MSREIVLVQCVRGITSPYVSNVRLALFHGIELCSKSRAGPIPAGPLRLVRCGGIAPLCMMPGNTLVLRADIVGPARGRPGVTLMDVVDEYVAAIDFESGPAYLSRTHPDVGPVEFDQLAAKLIRAAPPLPQTELSYVELLADGKWEVLDGLPDRERATLTMIAPPLEGLNSAMFEKRAIVYVPGGLVLTADFAKSLGDIFDRRFFNVHQYEIR